MIKLVLIAIFTTLALSQSISRIYISPTSDCSFSCSGNLTQPYNNLWIALQEKKDFPSQEFILLNSGSAFHYLTAFELGLLQNLTLEIKNNVTIRPLFCDDSIITQNSPLLLQCISSTSQIPIVLKSEDFEIIVRGSLTLISLYFDGTEDITKYQTTPLGANATYCQKNKIKCCDTLKSTYSATYPDVICSSSITRLEYPLSDYAFINLNPGTTGQTPAFYLMNCSIYSFYFLTSKSFLKIGINSTVKIDSFYIYYSVFTDGVFSSIDNSYSWKIGAISLNSVFFTNYNPKLMAIAFDQTALITVPQNSHLLITSSSFLSFRIESRLLLIKLNSNSNLTMINCNFSNLTLWIGNAIVMSTGSKITLIGNVISDSNIIQFTSFLSMSAGTFVDLKNLTIYKNTIYGTNLFNAGPFTLLNIENLLYDSNTIDDTYLFSIGENSKVTLLNSRLQRNEFIDASIFIHLVSNSIQTYENISILSNYFLGSYIIYSWEYSKVTVISWNLVSNTFLTDSFEQNCIMVLDFSTIRVANFTMQDTNVKSEAKASIFTVTSFTTFEATNLKFYNLIMDENSILFNLEYNSWISINDISFKNLIILNNQNNFGKPIIFFTGKGTELSITNISFEDSTFVVGGISIFDVYQFQITNMKFQNSVLKSGTNSNDAILFLNQGSGDSYIKGLDIVNMTTIEASKTRIYFFVVQNEGIVEFDDVKLYDNSIDWLYFKMFYMEGPDSNYKISNLILRNNQLKMNLVKAFKIEVLLKNMHIENSMFYDDMISIDTHGKVTMDSSSITNSSFITAYLNNWNEGTSLTINNTVFKNLNIKNSTFLYGKERTRINLESSLFTNITSSDSPGLITGERTTIFINKVTFLDLYLDSSASLISLLTRSTLELHQSKMLNIQRFGFLGRITYLVNAEYSKINISNIEINKFNYFLSGLSSEIYLINPLISNFEIINNAKIFISLTKSSIYAKKIIFDDLTSDKKNILLKLFSISESKATMENIVLKNFYLTQGTIFELYSTDISISQSSFQNITYSSSSKYLFLVLYGSYFFIENCHFEVNNPIISSTGNSVKILSTQIKVQNEVSTIIYAEGSSFFEFIDSSIILKPGNSFALVYGISLVNIQNEINLRNSNFSNGVTNEGMISLSLVSSGLEVSISNCHFIKNTANKRGSGAISIFDSGNVKYTFTNNTFRENKALSAIDIGDHGSGRGGAIYLSSLNQTGIVTNYTFQSCLFANNYAQYYGGAIYVYSIPPHLDKSNIFHNNTILQGELNDVGSQAIKLALENSDSISRRTKTFIPDYSSLDIGFAAVISGVASLKNNIVLLDMYNQILVGDSISTLQILKKKTNIGVSSSVIRSNRGAFSVENLILSFKPGSTIQISVSTNGIVEFLNLPISDQSNERLVTLEFRNCKQGELLQRDDTCFPCPEGSTHFHLEDNYIDSCIICPPSMMCLGGDQVFPAVGYFRLNSTADVFLKCPNGPVCKGGTLINQCQNGYEGNLCAQCTNGWGKTRMTGSCFDCLKTPYTYLILLAVLIFIIFLIVLNIKWIMKSTNSKTNEETNQRTLTTKLLINYAQLISLVSVVPIDWPTSFQELLEVNKTVSSATTDIFTLDCFFASFSRSSNIRKEYLKLLLFNLLPVFFSICGLLIWIIYFLAKKKKIWGNSDFSSSVILTVFVIFYYFQPTIINENFELLSCVNLYRTDTPVYFLQENYDIPCWTGSHKIWALGVALPSTLLWMFILPGYVIYNIKKNRRKQKEILKYDPYAYLTYGYKEEVFWWEVISISTKYLIIIGMNFASYDSNELQLFVAIYLFWIFYLIQVKNKPYIEQEFNSNHEAALICCMVVASAGIYFVMQPEDLRVRVVMILLAVASNIYYLWQWMKIFLKKKLNQIKEIGKKKCLRRDR